MDETTPTADAPIELPPLDAGADSNQTPYDNIPDEPTDDTPVKEEKQEQVDETPEESNDVLDAIKKQMGAEASDTTEDAPAEEKPAEDKPEEQPKEENKPVDPSSLDITDEELDRALDSIDNFRALVGKVEARTQQQFTAQLHRFGAKMSEVFEKMIYLHEATREFPEILAYQDAFRIAYNEACQGAESGDLRGPVFKAVEILRTEMGKLNALKSGRKVETRQKKAPKQPSGAGREAHSPKKSAPDDGITFLETLL